MVLLANPSDGKSPQATSNSPHISQISCSSSQTQTSPAKSKKCVNIAETPTAVEPVSVASEERAPSRVRVHFFESGASKCPSAIMDTSNGDVVNITTTSQQGNSYFRETQQVFTTSTPNGQQTSVRTVSYTARQSTDSGIDNPFRPEGELSMEADEIVKAIKEGRPFDSIDSGRSSRQANGSLNIKNGSAKSPSAKKEAKPGVVDVQRGIVVPPSDAQQVEQVVLKKKPKCKCCVIQ